MVGAEQPGWKARIYEKHGLDQRQHGTMVWAHFNRLSDTEQALIREASKQLEAEAEAARMSSSSSRLRGPQQQSCRPRRQI